MATITYLSYSIDLANTDYQKMLTFWFPIRSILNILSSTFPPVQGSLFYSSSNRSSYHKGVKVDSFMIDQDKFSGDNQHVPIESYGGIPKIQDFIKNARNTSSNQIEYACKNQKQLYHLCSH